MGLRVGQGQQLRKGKGKWPHCSLHFQRKERISSLSKKGERAEERARRGGCAVISRGDLRPCGEET